MSQSESKQSLRILFLEDSPADRELVAERLEAEGWVCHFAFVKTRRQFEAALADGKFDLILSDFTLPAYNGMDAIRAAQEAQPETPFLFVSGTIGEERAIQGIKAGARDCILKDHLEKLAPAVRRALQENEERKERRMAEDRLAEFSSLGERLAAAHTPRQAAEIIVDVADQLLRWDACTFDLYDEATQKITHVATFDLLGGERKEVPARYDGQAPSALAQRAINEGPILVLREAGGAAIHPLARPFGDMSRASASLMYVPIRNRTAVIGLCSIQSYKANAYTQQSLETLRALADHCGGALDRIKAAEALRLTQERMAQILARSPAVIYALKIEGDRITPSWVTDNIEALLGYNAAEALQPEWWVNSLHPQERETVLRGLKKLYAENQFEREFRVRRKNGEFTWVRDEQRLVRDKSGNPLEIVGSWTDITERKNLEEQFRQAQKMEAIGQLAGGVAHDFNNLLTVIRGNTELLLMMEGKLSDQAKEFLRQITSASDRAANLARQLLAFGRKQIMQARPLRLDQVITDLTKMLGRLIGAPIQLHLSSAPDLPFVHADAGMIEQVLMNLVINARDAMPDGGELFVELASATISEPQARAHPEGRSGAFVCLTVRDTGSGITPENLRRIFEPFFTTKAVGRGTGLGLATVYGIIKQHQGWVEVESVPGNGTTFRVYLPAITSPKGKMADITEDTKIRGGSETILLVEDNEQVRSLAKRILENIGYKICEAVSGKAALEVWESRHGDIDLIITDIIMPDRLTARELAERLLAEKPTLKIIFTSGHNPEVAGKDTGFFRKHTSWFLPKPYSYHRLLQTVRQCLDEKNPA
jgi:PAS domain S-box-containing protein